MASNISAQIPPSSKGVTLEANLGQPSAASSAQVAQLQPKQSHPSSLAGEAARVEQSANNARERASLEQEEKSNGSHLAEQTTRALSGQSSSQLTQEARRVQEATRRTSGVTTAVVMHGTQAAVVERNPTGQECLRAITARYSPGAYRAEALKRFGSRVLRTGTISVIGVGLAALAQGMIMGSRDAAIRGGSPFVFLGSTVFHTYANFKAAPWFFPALATVVVPCSETLYEELCKGPREVEFARWVLHRLSVFFAHLTVPQQYHGEEVFQNNLCLIGNVPVRMPVRDRYGNLYEAASVFAYLDSSSHIVPQKIGVPSAGSPLEPADLIVDEELFQRINDTLRRVGYQDSLLSDPQ